MSASDLALVDSLVEAGVYKTRSEAAAWLLHAGIKGKRALLDRVQGIIVQMCHLRDEAQHPAEGYTPG